MKDINIYKKFDEFINDEKYKKYFILIKPIEIFIKNLNKVKEYIEKYKQIPSCCSNIKDIKFLGKWISTQQNNFKYNKNIMKNSKIIYDLWNEFINDEKYKIYFNSFEEKFIINLDKVKNYFDKNKKKPSIIDKDKEIKYLSEWINTQQDNYNINNKKIKYKNTNILWKEFINDNKYKQYFQFQEENFKINLNELIKYIDINKKRPSKVDKDNKIKKLAEWVSSQMKNYKDKDRNMKNEIIYKEWTKFNDEYKEYFLTKYEYFILNLNKLKKYIDENNIKPSVNDIDKNIKFIGSWSSCQQANFSQKRLNMKDINIYNEWKKFINSEKYKKYFTNIMEHKFIITLDKVKIYIDENNKRPSKTNKDNNINILGTWITHQQSNYKNKTQNMKDINIYNKWTEFINDKKYKTYF